MTVVMQHHDTSTVIYTDEVDEAARKAVEEAIKHVCIPPEHRLRNDVRRLKLTRTGQRTRTAWVYVLNTPVEVMAECTLGHLSAAALANGQAHGTVILRLHGTRPHETYEFTFEREDYRMVITPVPELGH